MVSAHWAGALISSCLGSEGCTYSLFPELGSPALQGFLGDGAAWAGLNKIAEKGFLSLSLPPTGMWGHF